MCLLRSHSRRAVFAMLKQWGDARSALQNNPDVSADSATDVDVAMRECARLRVSVVAYFDDEFPPILREIPDPPALLYFRGNLELGAGVSVAIVGSRRCTAVGVNIAQHLARELGDLGINVVSGLALGIDSAAHRGALLAGDLSYNRPGRKEETETPARKIHAGKTIAVLGSGIGRIYPGRNRALAKEIEASGGLLLSEYEPLASPQRYQFPERNRLISGLSLGVVVVEASKRSGSLITARLALEQGRDVMAVPGTVGSANSPGCHRLLKQGAALIEDTIDVVEALGLVPEGGCQPTDIVASRRRLPEGELRQILESVRFEPTTVDEIVDASCVSTERVAAHLVELELEGFVQRVTEGYIRRPFG